MTEDEALPTDSLVPSLALILLSFQSRSPSSRATVSCPSED
ncbi:hypothetical protein [Pseudoruegeria sp. SK021]|nr:hypothetical protein [Pseudoruegeria sp. SK021]